MLEGTLPNGLPGSASQINMNNMPRHVAVIMDGNGRWATRRGLPRTMGHRAGMENVRRIVRLSGKLHLPVLTLYAFSTENWDRPKAEVGFLMNLIGEYLERELEELNKSGVLVRMIGDIAPLPAHAKQPLLEAMEKTKDNTGLVLNVALNYGGRDEIIRAVRRCVRLAQQQGLQPDDIDINSFRSYLYAPDLPDPDLIIRTSGECRLSNLMIYQSSYSELYFTDTLFPDFDEEAFIAAMIDYTHRKRRFGKVE